MAEPSGPDQFDSGGVAPLEVLAGDGRKRRIESDSDDGRPIHARRNSKKLRNSSPLLSPTAVERAQTVSSNTSEVTSRRAQQEAGPCQCKFCGVVVVGVKILCQGCSGSFHPDVLCLGVRSEAVRGLIADDEGALSYNCNECRLRVQAIDSGEGTNVVLRQLMCSVGELAKIVRGLKVDRNHSRDVIRDPMQQAASEACSEPISQRVILDQVREVREREKRADSVVFRGLGDVPLQEVSSKFLAICRELRLPSITLVGLTKIGTTNLYRARIADKDLRRSLLIKAPDLKQSQEFARVYINRDLTKHQRDEVMERRAHRRQAPNEEGPNDHGNLASASSSQAGNGISFANITSRPQRGNVAAMRGRFESTVRAGRGGISTRGRGAAAPGAAGSHRRGSTARNVVRQVPVENTRSRNGSSGRYRGRGRGVTLTGANADTQIGNPGRVRQEYPVESDETTRINYRNIPHVNF